MPALYWLLLSCTWRSCTLWRKCTQKLLSRQIGEPVLIPSVFHLIRVSRRTDYEILAKLLNPELEIRWTPIYLVLMLFIRQRTTLDLKLLFLNDCFHCCSSWCVYHFNILYTRSLTWSRLYLKEIISSSRTKVFIIQRWTQYGIISN